MNEAGYWKYRDWLLNTVDGRKQLLDYIITRKERSSPTCLDCGACCKKCKAYNHIEGCCSIWIEAKRVFHCDSYPLCPQVLEVDDLVDICRYYWD